MKIRWIIIFLLLFINFPALAAEDEYIFVVRDGDTARSLTDRYLVRPTAWEMVVQYNYILKPGNIIKVPSRLVDKACKAFIEVIYGDVFLKAAGRREWKPAVQDLILREGDTVKTGPNSGAGVVMGGGATMIMGAETEVIYQPYSRFLTGPINRLNILRGEVETIITPEAERRVGYEIVTPSSRLSLDGTRLRTKVGYGGETRLEVLEGEVTVDSSGQRSIVGAGMGALLGEQVGENE